MNGIYTGTVPTPTLISLSGEPVTLAELVNYCRTDLGVDDASILALGKAAREWFETACDRQFMTASWQMKLPGFYTVCRGRHDFYEFGAFGVGGRIELPYPPLRSVSLVQYLDLSNVLQSLDASLYNVVTSTTPGAIEPVWTAIWPTTYLHPEAVTITFAAGYGTATAVPELVKAGIKILTRHWYDNRSEATDIPPAAKAIAVSAGAYRF